MIINKVERSYIKHTDKEILGFFGPYRFLSNFEKSPIWYEGELYPSTENAYMAAKTLDLTARKQFLNIEPHEAKKLGRQIELRPDWHEVKEDIMTLIVFQKFNTNLELQKLLLDTGDAYLEETNHWGDKIWGCDENGEGMNLLGHLLMNIRTFFKNQKEGRDL